jgi:hypothetical protein
MLCAAALYGTLAAATARQELPAHSGTAWSSSALRSTGAGATPPAAAMTAAVLVTLTAPLVPPAAAAAAARVCCCVLMYEGTTLPRTLKRCAAGGSCSSPENVTVVVPHLLRRSKMEPLEPNPTTVWDLSRTASRHATAGPGFPSRPLRRCSSKHSVHRGKPG